MQFVVLQLQQTNIAGGTKHRPTIMGNSGLKQHYETAKKTGVLKLSQSKLEEFPPQLRALPANCLRTLDLSENKFAQIPDSIQSFVQLKILNISHNRLVTLPEVLGKLTKLENLNASNNRITALPASLSNLTHIKQVNLSDNRLTEFPLMLCGLKHLDVLDVSKNQLSVIPDGVSSLHVTELNLNQNQISTISDKLADCPRLKTLRLEENCLQLNALPVRILKESNISNMALEGNLFEMKQFADLDGYEVYMERYTAVKKKMFWVNSCFLYFLPHRLNFTIFFYDTRRFIYNFFYKFAHCLFKYYSINLLATVLWIFTVLFY